MGEQRHTIRLLKYRAQRQFKHCAYSIKMQVRPPFNPFPDILDLSIRLSSLAYNVMYISVVIVIDLFRVL